MVHAAMILLAFALALWTNKVTWKAVRNPGFLGVTQWDSGDYGSYCTLNAVPQVRIKFTFWAFSVVLNLLTIPLYLL